MRSHLALDAEDAWQLVGRARTFAEQLATSVCIAVVDRAGQLLAFLRTPGAPALSIQLAQDKAYSVTAFNGLPTGSWPAALADEPDVLRTIGKTDRLVMFGGGVPVLVAGEVIGAVGVSGGTADQDSRVAEQTVIAWAEAR